MAEDKDEKTPKKASRKRAKKTSEDGDTKKKTAPKKKSSAKKVGAKEAESSAGAGKSADSDTPSPPKPATEKAAKSSPQRGTSTSATHFLTGYPGFIGSRLVTRLAETDPEAQFALLVQPHLMALAKKTLHDLDAKVSGLADRTTLVTGDITATRLGIEAQKYDELTARVTEVWHLAAIYDLAVAPSIAYRVNVLGTANVLDLCQAAQGLNRLNYVSTCYVAGDRTGLVLESELDEGQGFKNHYESTKAWAELEVQRRIARIPTSIYRPGIVVGDSRTGETDKYDGPYYFIRFLMRLPGWLPMVNVGDGEALVNLVPVDYVVEAMVALSRRPEAVGTVFHLADPNPMRARDLLSLILKAMGRPGAFGAVSPDLFETLMSYRKVRQLLGMPREMLDYFNHPVRFDVTHALDHLADTDVRCPHISTYIRTLIEYVERNPKKEFLDRREL